MRQERREQVFIFIVVLIGFPLATCTFQDLSATNRERASLGDYDCVSVSPECAVLAAAAMQPTEPRTLLTIKALRASGAGAESVPVSVRVGECETPSPQPRPDENASGSGWTSSGSRDDDAGENLCGEDSLPTHEYDWGDFHLVAIDQTRCPSTNPSAGLDCVLGPDGTITIAVESSLGVANLRARTVPLCVSFRKQFAETPVSCASSSFSLKPSPDGSWLQVTRYLRVVDASASVRLGVALPDVARITPSCLGAGESCTTAAEYGSAVVGFVSSDTQSTATDEQLFLRSQVRQDVVLRLVPVQPMPNGQTPYFREDGDCSKEPQKMVTISIDSGQRSTQGVPICAPRFRGVYRLVASAEDHPELSGERTIEFLPSTIDVSFRRDATRSTPAVDVLTVERCGEPALPPPEEEVSRVSRGSVAVTGIAGSKTRFTTAQLCGIDDDENDGGAPLSCEGPWTVDLVGVRCEADAELQP